MRTERRRYVHAEGGSHFIGEVGRKGGEPGVALRRTLKGEKLTGQSNQFFGRQTARGVINYLATGANLIFRLKQDLVGLYESAPDKAPGVH